MNESAPVRHPPLITIITIEDAHPKETYSRKAHIRTSLKHYQCTTRQWSHRHPTINAFLLMIPVRNFYWLHGACIKSAHLPRARQIRTRSSAHRAMMLFVSEWIRGEGSAWFEINRRCQEQCMHNRFHHWCRTHAGYTLESFLTSLLTAACIHAWQMARIIQTLNYFEKNALTSPTRLSPIYLLMSDYHHHKARAAGLLTWSTAYSRLCLAAAMQIINTPPYMGGGLALRKQDQSMMKPLVLNASNPTVPPTQWMRQHGRSWQIRSTFTKPSITYLVPSDLGFDSLLLRSFDQIRVHDQIAGSSI